MNTTQSPFDWKFLNVVSGKIVERHYKCTKTGAYKCTEFKFGGNLTGISYSLPNSTDYNITTEEALQAALTKTPMTSSYPLLYCPHCQHDISTDEAGIKR